MQEDLKAIGEKPLRVFKVMKRVIIRKSRRPPLLLKMRDDDAVHFDIHKGVWQLACGQGWLSPFRARAHRRNSFVAIVIVH